MSIPKLLIDTSPEQSAVGVLELSCAMSRAAFPWIEFEPHNRKHFQGRVFSRKVGQTLIVENSFDQCRLNIRHTEGWHFLLPTFGSFKTECEKRLYETRTGDSVLLLPNVDRRTERNLDRALVFSIDVNRLERTLGTILGLTEGVAIKIPVHPHLMKISSFPDNG